MLYATSHGLGMTLGMTLVYPVQWGVVILGAHDSCRILSALRENSLGEFAEEEKSAKREIKCYNSREFRANVKNKPT